MPLAIVTHNNYKVLIPSTANAVISEEFEFSVDKYYTVMCSPLDLGERISLEIYNHGDDNWQSFKISGNTVALTKDYETLLISEVAAVCRFNKTATTNPISLNIGSR